MATVLGLDWWPRVLPTQKQPKNATAPVEMPDAWVRHPRPG
eukprot:COSAG06_NODE_43450_length_372_cov_0.560440_1_plen_41_part_01